jgi:hypothetical protein
VKWGLKVDEVNVWIEALANVKEQPKHGLNCS